MFDQVFMDYQTWNERVVDFLVATGVINKEMGEIWKSTSDYIPYYRQLEDPTIKESLKPNNNMFGGMTVRPPQELKGATDIYVLEVGETDSQGNETLTQLPFTFTTKEDAEAYADELRRETPTLDVRNPKQVKTAVNNIVNNVAQNLLAAIQSGLTNVMYQRAMKNMYIQFPDQVKRRTPVPGTVTFRVDGEEVTLTVPDKMAFAAFQNLQFRVNDFMKWPAIPARILRETVTRSPDFLLRNMARDTFSAWLTTGVGTNRSYIPGYSTLTGFVKALNPNASESARRLKEAGAMTSYEFSGDPSDAEAGFNRKYRRSRKSAIDRIKKNPFAVGVEAWEGLGRLTMASDLGTRIAVYEATLAHAYKTTYKKALKEYRKQYGRGPEAEERARAEAEEARINAEPQALFEAKEVINFGSKGTSHALRYLAVMIPFLNARIQGLDVLNRALFGRSNVSKTTRKLIKKRAWTRALLIATAAIGYSVLMEDDDEYNRQTPETRDNYIIVPSRYIPGYDGPALRIPKPFEVGLMFFTLPERLHAYMSGRDTPMDFWDSAKRGVRSTMAVDLPQVISPLFDVMQGEHGYSPFLQREIEGGAIRNLDPWKRTKQSTTEIAKDLGQAAFDPDDPLSTGLSPVKIDYLIRGYVGTLGLYLYLATDELYRTAKGMVKGEPLPEKPDKRWSENMFIRSFFAQPDARGPINEFYHLNKLVTNAVNTVNQLEKEGAPIADRVALAKSRLVEIADEFKAKSDELRLLRTDRLEIQKDPTLGGAEKRKLIDDITQQELLIVGDLGELKKYIQEEED